MKLRLAPQWDVDGWLNTDRPLSLPVLKGKVIALYAFQMLCPGCIHNSVPQAQRVHDAFSRDDVAVIGLHTVFEHHEAMRRPALEAFAHEFRLGFPIGIDRHENGEGMPRTMKTYNMQGTPTLVLIDGSGMLRKQKFGHEHDLVLGAEIMSLIREKPE
ncbi:MAG: redoxin domain-containing protein [Proteobacteria bacterium]|nr:redoxin domain-containing protein [Pseudomonadota bacterium]